MHQQQQHWCHKTRNVALGPCPAHPCALAPFKGVSLNKCIYLEKLSPLHASATHHNLAGSQAVTEFRGYRQQSSPCYISTRISQLAAFCADKRFQEPEKLIHCIDRTNKLQKNTKDGLCLLSIPLVSIPPNNCTQSNPLCQQPFTTAILKSSTIQGALIMLP